MYVSNVRKTAFFYHSFPKFPLIFIYFYFYMFLINKKKITLCLNSQSQIPWPLRISKYKNFPTKTKNNYLIKHPGGQK